MKNLASWLSAVLVGATAWVNAGRAEALTAVSPMVFPIDSGRCYRSPDITFDGDSYYVAFAVAPCTGPGTYEVKLIRFDPTFRVTSDYTVLSGNLNGTTPPSPLVSVSSVSGSIVVATTLRGAGVTTIRAVAITGMGTPRVSSMQQTSSDANVRALSVDCQPDDPATPCALATIEELGIGSRAHVRGTLGSGRNVGPTTLLMGQNVTAISAVSGASSIRGAAVTTDFIGSSAFFGPTSGSFVDIERRLPIVPVMRGVAATRTRSGVAAIWSVPGELTFATGAGWGSLAYARLGLAARNAIFVVNDAVEIGRTVAIVGRATSITGSLDDAPFSLLSLSSMSTGPLAAEPSMQPMTSDARIAASKLCPELGSAVAVYSTNVGSPPVGGLAVVRYRCSADSECLDAEGNPGACVSGGCVFRAGPCVPDSGVPMPTDASTPDATPIVPPIDVEPADATADADDAHVSRPDSASGQDANPQIISRRVEYRGGACQCRAGAVRGRVSSLPFVVAGLALAASIRRRRR